MINTPLPHVRIFSHFKADWLSVSVRKKHRSSKKKITAHPPAWGTVELCAYIHINKCFKNNRVIEVSKLSRKVSEMAFFLDSKILG